MIMACERMNDMFCDKKCNRLKCVYYKDKTDKCCCCEFNPKTVNCGRNPIMWLFAKKQINC